MTTLGSVRNGYVDMGWFDEPVDMGTALKNRIVHKTTCGKEVAALQRGKIDYLRSLKMELKGLRVKTITYPHGEYRLGSPAEIVDEGSFYRIDGTHIFDKHKIKEIRKSDRKIEINMTDKFVVLETVPNK